MHAHTWIGEHAIASACSHWLTCGTHKYTQSPRQHTRASHRSNRAIDGTRAMHATVRSSAIADTKNQYVRNSTTTCLCAVVFSIRYELIQMCYADGCAANTCIMTFDVPMNDIDRHRHTNTIAGTAVKSTKCLLDWKTHAACHRCVMEHEFEWAPNSDQHDGKYFYSSRVSHTSAHSPARSRLIVFVEKNSFVPRHPNCTHLIVRIWSGSTCQYLVRDVMFALCTLRMRLSTYEGARARAPARLCIDRRRDRAMGRARRSEIIIHLFIIIVILAHNHA